MNGKSKDKFKRLRIFNGIMGVFHLFQSILILFLSNSFSIPILNSFRTGAPAHRAAE